MPLERKTPVAYPDGVYEIAGQDRPNVLLIANVTQNGLTGFGSRERTALFIFFGKLFSELKVGVYMTIGKRGWKSYLDMTSLAGKRGGITNYSLYRKCSTAPYLLSTYS